MTTLEILTFDVAGNTYAVLARDVDELTRAVAIVPLPKAAAIVEGVVDRRGHLVPVLDIRSRFALPKKDLQPSDHLVFVRAGARPVALRIERPGELTSVDSSEVEAVRALVPSSKYVSGVAKLEAGIALIYDLDSFLSEAESATLDDALTASGTA